MITEVTGYVILDSPGEGWGVCVSEFPGLSLHPGQGLFMHVLDEETRDKKFSAVRLHRGQAFDGPVQPCASLG